MSAPHPPSKPRARDLGIPFDGPPGPLNAITDVAGVLVGHTTLIHDGPTAVRTGVTAILPGPLKPPGVPAAWFSLNGAGEMTGTAWLDEAGLLESPILLTNTNSVGVVRDAVVRWNLTHYRAASFSLPVVTETWDGLLNDVNGFHVRPEHAIAAIDNAAGGAVPEGNVGGGTGMVAFKFKGGIGTSSRIVRIANRDYTLGVLVQANFGQRHHLYIAGIPVGQLITDLMPTQPHQKDGSIIVIVATDAPLLPHQLKRLCRRVPLGLGRIGAIAGNTSGDLFVAFSTALPATASDGIEHWQSLPHSRMDDLFAATIQATEEATINALVAAETMTGFNGTTVYGLPHERVRELLRGHGRIAEK